MKKVLSSVFVVLAFVLLSGMVGCGNSTDGDSQKPNDGEYGRMSDLYGPAGDGRGSRK